MYQAQKVFEGGPTSGEVTSPAGAVREGLRPAAAGEDATSPRAEGEAARRWEDEGGGGARSEDEGGEARRWDDAGGEAIRAESAGGEARRWDDAGPASGVAVRAGAPPPAVRDADADRRFRERARRHGWAPDDPFVGGYVDWEWRHSRLAYDGLFTSVRGRRVLEFGCHFGGTAVVLAALGARVTAIDVDPRYVELTRLNAERYGFADRVRVRHVPDTRGLPFAPEAFDLVSCNSVLEYVPPATLGAVQRELDRVLAPGGFVVVLGTSNRLWPYEMHTGRWLANYVPQPLGRMLPGTLRQGVFPRRLRRGFGDHYADLTARDGGRLVLVLKAKMGAERARLGVLAALNRVLGRVGAHAGLVTPTITMVLQKGAAASDEASRRGAPGSVTTTRRAA